MEYTKLLREAYLATFAHKRMWWLGMVILTSGGLGSQVLSNSARVAIDSADTTALSNAVTEWFNDPGVQDWWADKWWLVVVGLGLVLLLWLVAALTHLVAQSGLYYGAQQVRLGQPVTFIAMCRVGFKTIWRYFGFYVLLACARVLAGLAFILTIITLTASVVGIIFAIPLLLGAILFGWTLAIVVEVFVIYCLQGITLHQHSSWDTFAYAWQTLRQHWWDSVLMALLVFLLQIVIGLVSFFLYLILIVPFAILAYVAYTSEAWLMIVLSLAVGSTVILAIWLTIKGMVQSFYAHLWQRVYASF